MNQNHINFGTDVFPQDNVDNLVQALADPTGSIRATKELNETLKRELDSLQKKQDAQIRRSNRIAVAALVFAGIATFCAVVQLILRAI